MNMFEREQKTTLVERFREPPRFLIIVNGPRQCGKTTVLHQALKASHIQHLYVAVDRMEINPDLSIENIDSYRAPGAPEDYFAEPRVNQADAEWLIRIWQEARAKADQSESGYILALDEIQKIPNWSEIVKGLWDQDQIEGRKMHVVLLGSAPLLMQQGLNESLAGRFETIRLNHWSFSEMAAAFDFDLDKFIYFGGYPKSASFIDNEDRWRNYVLDALVNTCIERDILALQRIDKPILLKRLFELGSTFSGQELSYTKMLGSLQDAGNTTTLARYLDLMSQVKLISGLSKFSSNLLRRGSSPKLIVHNTALMSASSGYTFEEAKSDRTFWGRLVESAVGAHLLNSLSPRAELSYWRKDNFEVDFVVARANHLTAIEVKSGRQRFRMKGIDKFEENFSNRARSINRLGIGGSETELAEFLATPASEQVEG